MTQNNDPVIGFYEEMPFPNNPGIVPAIATIFGRVKVSGIRNILIVGCGTGEDILAARMVYPHAVIHAVEPSKMSCQIAYDRAPFAKIFCDTIERAELPTTYDLIICTGVLHHLVDPEKALLRIVDFKRPGGCILLGVYHHSHWDFDPTNLNPVNRADYEDHPRAVTFSWHGLYRLADRVGLVMGRNSHRLPSFYNRFTRSVYDGLFSYTGQSMMYVVLK